MLNSSSKQRPHRGPSAPTLPLLLLAALFLSFSAQAQEAEVQEQAAENAPSQVGSKEGALEGVAEAVDSEEANAGEPAERLAAGQEPSEAGDGEAGDELLDEQEASANAQQEPRRKTGPRLTMAIPAGKENEVLKLFKPMALGSDLPGDYKWHSLSIEAQSLSARLASQSKDQPDLKVSFVALVNHQNVTGTEVKVEPAIASLPANAQQAVAAFRKPVEKKLTPKSWAQLMKPIKQSTSPEANPDGGLLLLVGALGALVLGTLVGVVLLRKRAPRVEG